VESQAVVKKDIFSSVATIKLEMLKANTLCQSLAQMPANFLKPLNILAPENDHSALVIFLVVSLVTLDPGVAPPIPGLVVSVQMLMVVQALWLLLP